MILTGALAFNSVGNGVCSMRMTRDDFWHFAYY